MDKCDIWWDENFYIDVNWEDVYFGSKFRDFY